MGWGLKTCKTEMTGTGGGRWAKRAFAKKRAKKARRAVNVKEVREGSKLTEH